MIESYNAFISYRHVERDIRVAEDIQKQLEHYKIPKAITEKTGIRKLDTITEHTNKLVELKLIEKTYTFEGGKRQAHYKIITPKINFMWVSNDLFDLKNPGLIGFIVKMAGLR